QHVARHAVLRDHVAGGPADDQPRSPRSGVARRCQRLEALLVRHVAAPETGHGGGRRLLDHPDVLGLQAHLRADGRRPGELDAPARDVRLPDRCGDRSPGRGRGDLALHAPGPLHRGLGPAPLSAPAGGAVMASGAIIEPRWKTWVFFYIPLTAFIIGTLFPLYWMLITSIRPDSELYRSSRAVNNAPFWPFAPTLEPFRDLMAKTTFPIWLWNTFFIAVVTTLSALPCG